MAAPPTRAAVRPALVLGLGALAAASLGLGWWLGDRHGSSQAGSSPRAKLEREVQQLQRRQAAGEASSAEQQRLLELLVGLERRQEAVPLLERLADQQPDRWSLRLLLAELRRDQQDRPGAERELRQLLHQRPDQIEALQLMTLLQLESGRGALAQQQLEAAWTRNSEPSLKPQALAIGLLLADLQQRRGQAGAAEATLIRVNTRFPGDPRPLLARALLQQERGDRRGAQRSLAEARSRQRDPKAQAELDRVAAAWGLQALRPAATDGAGDGTQGRAAGTTTEGAAGTAEDAASPADAAAETR
jgi:tetratricopeptide (TPR) repeat protein